MATATAPQSNGITPPAGSQYGQAFSRITSVPLVAESLNAAHSTLESHPVLARPYHVGGSVVSSSLKAAEPVTTRLQPQLAFLDTYALKGLDFAESKWSYPFKATPEDVYKTARQPADQALSYLHTYAQAVHKQYDEKVFAPAKSIYDTRVAPAYDSASAQFQELKSQNAVLQRAVDVVSNLQTNLAKTVESLSGRGKAEGDAVAQKAQGLSNALFAELDRVRGFALSLPAESRKRIHPVLDTFTETYEKLNKEARNTSIPASQRFINVIEFVQKESLPALQKAIVNPSPAAQPATTSK